MSTAAPPVTPDRVLVRALRKQGPFPALFCVVAPGVNALGYTSLARALGPGETACVVQGHGTPRSLGPYGRREYGLEECESLATAYLAALKKAQPEGPYFLAGMCEGAHLALAVARKLEAEGARVALLAMLDTWPLQNTSRPALVMLEGLRRRLGRMSQEERRTWISTRAKNLVGLLRARLFGGRAAAAGKNEGYRHWRARVWPGKSFTPPRYGGPITVLSVRHQPYWRIRDEHLGWRAWTRARVERHIVPGEHATLLRAPHVESVAQILTSCLAAARSGASATIGEAR
ncbi:Non-ribosomal peptide synthetase [Minicystis rosea]|nr:Non-ribosomal peptide synthetase [Minicystis rosea]